MNRPRMATVLSAREWEPRLVDAARRDPIVRIVRRAYEPQDLERAAPLDIVVVGSETSWITSNRIRLIRRSGTHVIGVYPTGDGPGHELLRRGGVDVALPDTTTPEDLLSAASVVAAQSLAPVGRGRLISVTGPRGAPGRTEIAVSVAYAIAERISTAIVDLDTEAPGVTFRMGFEPGANLIDIADAIRTTDRLVARDIRPNLTAIGGPVPLRTDPSNRLGIAALLDAVLAAFPVTVADIGPWRPDHSILATSDAAVVVCDASPMSLIRAVQFVRDWEGPIPYVVINRVGSAQEEDILRSARRAMGLEPHTLIPELSIIDGREGPALRHLLESLAIDLLAGPLDL